MMIETVHLWEMYDVGRDQLELRQIPIPKPQRGEVLVQVAAVALSYRDKMVTESGRGQPLSFPSPRFRPVGESVQPAAETPRHRFE